MTEYPKYKFRFHLFVCIIYGSLITLYVWMMHTFRILIVYNFLFYLIFFFIGVIIAFGLCKLAPKYIVNKEK